MQLTIYPGVTQPCNYWCYGPSSLALSRTCPGSHCTLLSLSLLPQKPHEIWHYLQNPPNNSSSNTNVTNKLNNYCFALKLMSTCLLGLYHIMRVKNVRRYVTIDCLIKDTFTSTHERIVRNKGRDETMHSWQMNVEAWSCKSKRVRWVKEWVWMCRQKLSPVALWV